MMKKYINIKNSIRILFLIYIMCNIYNAEIAKVHIGMMSIIK